MRGRQPSQVGLVSRSCGGFHGEEAPRCMPILSFRRKQTREWCLHSASDTYICLVKVVSPWFSLNYGCSNLTEFMPQVCMLMRKTVTTTTLVSHPLELTIAVLSGNDEP